MGKMRLVYTGDVAGSNQFVDALKDDAVKDKFVTQVINAGVTGGVLSRVFGAKVTEPVIEQRESGHKSVEIKEGGNQKGILLELISHFNRKGVDLSRLICEGDDKTLITAFENIKGSYLKDPVAVRDSHKVSSSEEVKTDVESASSSAKSTASSVEHFDTEPSLSFAELKRRAQATGVITGKKVAKAQGSGVSLENSSEKNQATMPHEMPLSEALGPISPMTLSWNSRDLKDLKKFKMSISSVLQQYIMPQEAKAPSCMVMNKSTLDDASTVDEAFVCVQNEVYYVNKKEGVCDRMDITPSQLAAQIGTLDSLDAVGRMLTEDELDLIRAETNYLRPDDVSSFQITIDKQVGSDVLYDALAGVKKLLGGGFPPKRVDLNNVTCKSQEDNPLKVAFNEALDCHLNKKGRPDPTAMAAAVVEPVHVQKPKPQIPKMGPAINMDELKSKFKTKVDADNDENKPTI